jgi:hypothetical protein
MNKSIVLRNVKKRIVQRACTLFESPTNDEALDLCDVVEEDEADSEGIGKLVGASKTSLTKLVGAACDVPVR